MHILYACVHVKLKKKRKEKREREFKRKVPFEASMHHRSHACKLSPAVQHHQENHRKYYVSQSKEVKPVITRQ